MQNLSLQYETGIISQWYNYYAITMQLFPGLRENCKDSKMLRGQTEIAFRPSGWEALVYIKT